MKRFLLFIASLSLSGHWTLADVVFDPDTKYRMVCAVNPNGSVVLGSKHGSPAYLYYAEGVTGAEDAWWYIRQEGKGYTFTNAATGLYITYDPNRIPDVAKGLVVSYASMGSTSQWHIEPGRDGYFTIQSVDTPGQWFNLRRDGSNLLGTYEGSGAVNELFAFYDEEGNSVGNEEKPTENPLQEALDSVRLNNKQLVYDQTDGTYWMALPASLRQGGNLTTTFTWKCKPGYENYTLTLDGQQPNEADGSVTLKDVDCEKTCRLELLDGNGEKKAQARVQFTFLPLVEINMPSCNGVSYTQGTIRVTQPDEAGHDSTYIAAYRYRGATAQGYEKKAYAIKLRDKDGESVDREFFGLRKDNNWILDAMAVDPACMRNRVATDLWNDFATPPYYKDREKKARTGTRGRFVEVFLNGSYHGLYCMTEKMDRKQLKLKKYVAPQSAETGGEQVRGLLYKSSQWGYEVFMGHEADSRYFPGYAPSPYSNKLGTEVWANYELKYPDYEEEAVEWRPLWQAVNFVATSTQEEFEDGVKTYFDYPMLKDYYLFIDLLLATDNHGKNMFFYIYDCTGQEGERISIAPWDLDGTWGARWDGSTYLCHPRQDYDEFLWQNEHGQHTLYHKLQQSTTLNWQEELAARYAELRFTHFDPDRLAERVADYAALFADSKADSREQRRWPKIHSDIQEATEYARAWVKERIGWLDEKYGFDPVASSLNESQAAASLSVNGGKGCITVISGKEQTLSIYDLKGNLLRETPVKRGRNVINGFTAGVYVAGTHKVVVN